MSGTTAIVLALTAGALFGCSEAADMEAATALYEQPGLLATLPDGRRLNLRCSGHGSPTVLLESGFGASSSAWGKVAPAVSRFTRVCAYDRAGSGFSDPGPAPRDGEAIARDLDQALLAARINGPFVVVGHSVGGLYARLFAARRPQDVKGLVLLDPTIEARVTPSPHDGLEGQRRRARRCLAAAEADPQPPQDDPQWSGCAPAWAGSYAWAVARRPATWQAQLSELDAIFGRTSDETFRIGSLLSDIPIYVLTASDTAASAPKVPLTEQSAWELEHMQLAFSFRHGWQRTVLSSHLIMNDRPELVIAAVEEMVAATRAGRIPEPLPPSETGPGGLTQPAFPENPGVTK